MVARREPPIWFDAAVAEGYQTHHSDKHYLTLVNRIVGPLLDYLEKYPEQERALQSTAKLGGIVGVAQYLGVSAK